MATSTPPRLDTTLLAMRLMLRSCPCAFALHVCPHVVMLMTMLAMLTLLTVLLWKATAAPFT